MDFRMSLYSYLRGNTPATLSLFLFLNFIAIVHGAENEWTWINGLANPARPANYGTQGIPSAENLPPERFEAVSWTDYSGNLWMFGGGLRNDLWKYDPVTTQWVWKKGSSLEQATGIYGTIGLPASENVPGARDKASSWVDTSGTLWLFGGLGMDSTGSYGNLNDLWKYDPALNEWTWMHGGSVANLESTYGVQGTSAHANSPGARFGSVSWTDNSGNLWLFGGNGFGAAEAGNNGPLNDLWKYDTILNQWTWMKSSSNPAGRNGVYGTKGQADPANIPGSRYQCASWVDSAGYLWLYGGFGLAMTGFESDGYLNDLWKYNPISNEWTWVNGSSFINANGIYGSIGTPAAGNSPGGRTSAVSWFDAHGSLWLFGGNGEGATGYGGPLNDLWKYDLITDQWTWMHGSTAINQPGQYGTLGLSSPVNTPGTRFGSVAWTDNTGQFWLFGGNGRLNTSLSGISNDLWRYNPTTNEWTSLEGNSYPDCNGIYGSKGQSSLQNLPGERVGSVTWTDNSGNLWLFGGHGTDSSAPSQMLNDLWRYSVATSQWTWISGSNSGNQHGIYGTVGLAAPSNCPGSRSDARGWTDLAGNFWLFGGYGWAQSGGPSYLNDLWKFNPTTQEWTWMKGGSATWQGSVYGTRGSASPASLPGARAGFVSWRDIAGHLWLFGGRGKGIANVYSELNDLWKYNPATNEWAWMHGSNTGVLSGIYGTQGTTDVSNTPGARDVALGWSDSVGKLWLFGGYGYGSSPSAATLTDLWKFDPDINQWTWMKGSNSISEATVYGNRGVTSVHNTPGKRLGSLTWADNNGNFWLFGGNGFGGSTTYGKLNDLWKYNPTINQWMWVTGSQSPDEYGHYGIKGISSPANTPGGRWSSAVWTDGNGDLWLFGSEKIQDLWKFQTSISQIPWSQAIQY